MAQAGSAKEKFLLSDSTKRSAHHINAYLVPDGSNVIVRSAKKSISGLPQMLFGSKPTDGGGLILTPAQRTAIIDDDPRAEKFIRRFIGSDDLINGKERYCLWIPDSQVRDAEDIAPIVRQLAAVGSFRSKSKKADTRRLASSPHRFGQSRHQESTAILVPRHSSRRRQYVPLGFVDELTVIADSANAIYRAGLWLFGLIQSRMHMVWLEAVGGRLKTDYRYSAVLVYNTFPVPELSASDKDALKAGAVGVLAAREQFSDQTLAELYDPDKMPAGLLSAHETLDETVDRLYRARAFESDEERLKVLFGTYEETVAEQGVANA